MADGAPGPIPSLVFSSTYVNLNFLDFPVDTRNTDSIIHRMNTEQITEAILNYMDTLSEDEATNPRAIQALLFLDHNVEVGLDFIIETINETIGYADDVSDEGFDPYLNCYTDDC
jgi:hypothetical protein